MKSKPLTKKDVDYYTKVNKKHYYVEIDDVLSAVNGLINDVNNLKNRDDMVKAVLLVCDGGGVGRFEVISLINKWFNFGDKIK